MIYYTADLIKRILAQIAWRPWGLRYGIKFLRNLQNNFIGILLGPTDLEGFKIFIRSFTSTRVTGVRKSELQILLDK